MARDVSLPSDFAGDGQLFVRNATGLVREVSRWDALIMNTLGMNVALGAIFMLLQAPGNFPGGNMLLAIAIGTLVMAFTLLWVYSEFAAAMPRAGGDYVFVSRALHPIAGWLMSWSQGLWLIFFWIGFNAWFALTFAAPVAMTTLGVVTGHSGNQEKKKKVASREAMRNENILCAIISLMRELDKNGLEFVKKDCDKRLSKME